MTRKCTGEGLETIENRCWSRREDEGFRVWHCDRAGQAKDAFVLPAATPVGLALPVLPFKEVTRK